MIDCKKFSDGELEALHEELDPAAAAELAAHAATCSSCSARFERLRKHRSRILAVAIEPVAPGFEDRIMAAVDAAMARRAAPAGAIATIGPALAAAKPAAANAEPSEGGAKIFRFMSRPAFSVAATFVLVIGAAAVLMSRGMSKSMAPMASSADQAPAASGALADNRQAPDEEVAAAAAPAAMATATAPMVAPVATPTPMAFNEPRGRADGDPMAAAAAGGAPPSQPKPAAIAPPPPHAAAKVAAPRSGAGSSATDPAFAAATSLASSGRCAEALPKLEALAATHPEAKLHAARCVAQLQGCVAAAPRFDRAAQDNAGTETGHAASLEAAKCRQSIAVGGGGGGGARHASPRKAVPASQPASPPPSPAAAPAAPAQPAPAPAQ